MKSKYCVCNFVLFPGYPNKAESVAIALGIPQKDHLLLQAHKVQM